MLDPPNVWLKWRHCSTPLDWNPTPIAVRSITIIVSICMSVCPPACISEKPQTSPNFCDFNLARTVLLWLQCNTLCISGFVDDVIFQMARHRRQGWSICSKWHIGESTMTTFDVWDLICSIGQTFDLCGTLYIHGWLMLGSRVVSVLDSGAVGPGFKSQSRRCRVTVLGKLFTPIVPMFTKQQNW